MDGLFGTLGSAVVDGGAPFGPSTAVQSDGSAGNAAAGLTGYSIRQADSLELAAKLASGCQVLSIGSTVEVYEVDAVVSSGGMPYVLLGNSFLARFQMVRTNDQMVLEKRY